MLVKPEVARRQLDAEAASSAPVPAAAQAKPAGDGGAPPAEAPRGGDTTGVAPKAAQPTRFHGSVMLDATRVGRDAGRIADEVIAHLAGLVGANVTVTLEIEAEIPSRAPEHVVRVVTENSRTLKFASLGFEKE